MGAIPKMSSFGNMTSTTPSQGYIQRATSLNEIGNIFQNRLEGIRDKIVRGQQKINAKKADGKSGIDAFIVDEDSDESQDSFEEANQGHALMNNEEDPSKLIDLELVNLLRYCHELLSHKDTEDY